MGGSSRHATAWSIISAGVLKSDSLQCKFRLSERILNLSNWIYSFGTQL
jgi:hypothetical protein